MHKYWTNILELLTIVTASSSFFCIEVSWPFSFFKLMRAIFFCPCDMDACSAQSRRRGERTCHELKSKIWHAHHFMAHETTQGYTKMMECVQPETYRGACLLNLRTIVDISPGLDLQSKQHVEEQTRRLTMKMTAHGKIRQDNFEVWLKCIKHYRLKLQPKVTCFIWNLRVLHRRERDVARHLQVGTPLLASRLQGTQSGL